MWHRWTWHLANVTVAHVLLQLPAHFDISLFIALGTLEPLGQASKFISSTPLGQPMYVLLATC
jgi:hypothetical protein